MPQITQDNILFVNVYNGSSNYTGGKIGSFRYNWDTVNPELITFRMPIINAIDIDWDGATLSDGTVINTTGKLLAYISNLETQLIQLGASVNIAEPQGINFKAVKYIYKGDTPVNELYIGQNKKFPVVNYIDDQVTYEGISNIITVGSKITNETYIINSDDEIISHANVVNAIDIDWNDATYWNVSNIKTSGQLLSIIDQIAQGIRSLGGTTAI